MHYKNLGNSNSCQLPIPLLNIINGGVHAKNNLDIQEFMIRPEKSKTCICLNENTVFSKMSPSRFSIDFERKNLQQ